MIWRAILLRAAPAALAVILWLQGAYAQVGGDTPFSLGPGSVTPPQLAPSTLTAGTSVSLTAPRQYYICTGTCTITPPPPVAGYEFCAGNDNNVATVITFAALGSSAMYLNQAGTAYGTAGTGTFVSGAAVNNWACLIGRDSTHYLTKNLVGTWTAS